MPSTPRGDEPSLPKLRRFRFDTEDPKRAREVTDDATPTEQSPPGATSTDKPSAGPTPVTEDAAASPATSDAQAPTSDSAADAPAPSPPTTAPDARSAQDLDESERLLADLSGAPKGPPTEHRAARTAAPADAGHHRTTDTRGGPRGPQARGPHEQSRAIPASAATAPASRGRSPWPYALGGLAAALVIGLVAWLVFAPEDDEPDNSQQNSAGETSQDVVTEWASDVCSVLTDYETQSIPLRAEIAKATSEEDADVPISELRRQAGQLLDTLGGNLQSIELPAQSNEAKSAHTMLISAVTAASSAAKSGGTSDGATVGSPGDAATVAAEDVVDALDRPVDIFAESIDTFGEDTRTAVQAQPTCEAVLTE
ncbi:hypothetical protein [Cumulibacter soli]|uniref:hypothetical protein n=1 Tax=Cumulibacter soli TaxID=2546344 RepID=UPI00106830A7|nr:hypothetical protein [Cumulibacter soli]